MNKRIALIKALCWWVILTPIFIGMGLFLIRNYPEGEQCMLYHPYPSLFPDIVQEVCISTGVPSWVFIVVTVLAISLPIVIAQRIYIKGSTK